MKFSTLMRYIYFLLFVTIFTVDSLADEHDHLLVIKWGIAYIVYTNFFDKMEKDN